jgi:hypothetical protein
MYLIKSMDIQDQQLVNDWLSRNDVTKCPTGETVLKRNEETKKRGWGQGRKAVKKREEGTIPTFEDEQEQPPKRGRPKKTKDETKPVEEDNIFGAETDTGL